MTSAVVFAYHNVGVRGLTALLAQRVSVPLVVTHEDRADEQIWFDSVAALARKHGIETITPEDANAPDVVQRIRALAPDFIFSFYYRQMLGAELLACARRGAYNLHGSLLPKYRGRVPINWAVIHGERETGATLHRMEAKPDAGGIVGQEAVPIGPDETAREVFDKVVVATDRLLVRALPGLLAGTAVERPQDLARGSYFTGRKPQDGAIDWAQPARRIHDLVRGVTHPYPGAFTTLGGKRLNVWRTQVLSEAGAAAAPRLGVEAGSLVAHAGNGGSLRLLESDWDGAVLTPARFSAAFPQGRAPLPS